MWLVVNKLNLFFIKTINGKMFIRIILSVKDMKGEWLEYLVANGVHFIWRKTFKYI